MNKKKVISLITAVTLMINMTGCSKKIEDEDLTQLCTNNLLTSINNSLLEDSSSVAYKIKEMGINIEELENDFIHYYENKDIKECNDIIYLLSRSELQVLIADMYGVSPNDINNLKVSNIGEGKGYITYYNLDNCVYKLYSSNDLFTVMDASNSYKLGFSDGVINLNNGYNIVKKGLMFEAKYVDSEMIINDTLYSGCLNLDVNEQSYNCVSSNIEKENTFNYYYLNTSERILK